MILNKRNLLRVEPPQCIQAKPTVSTDIGKQQEQPDAALVHELGHVRRDQQNSSIPHDDGRYGPHTIKDEIQTIQQYENTYRLQRGYAQRLDPYDY
jgi:hypothetical protein